MTISLRHLEIFHAVILSGGATQAASLLRTSQPTVSRELRDLERHLGFQLFTRKGRHLLPTESALALYSEVRRSFVGLEKIVRAADAIRANAAEHINIGCLPAYSATLLPEICRGFLDAHPATRLSIHSFEQPAIVNGLSTRHYDLGIMEIDKKLAGANVLTIDMGEELCVLPKGHRLAEKKTLAPEDFEGVDFIYFSADDTYRRKLDEVFHEFDIARRLRVEATTATSVCALVAQGLGVSIVNPISALHCRDKDVELRRFSVPIPYSVGLYHSPHGRNSDLTRKFLGFCASALYKIREVASEIP